MTGLRALDIDGVAIRIREDGPEDGPAVVFSNSLGTDLRIWDALLTHLPPGLRVVRYDKRGHGLSDCPQGAWGMDEHIADLCGVLDALDIRGAVIVGLSVGGLIAQGLAARRPDLARALVLMDTAAKIGDAALWNARIEAIGAGGIGAIGDGILERWFTQDFRAGDPAFPLWRNMLLRTPRAGYLRTAAAIRDTDFTDQARALAIPVLAMAGNQDGATPPGLVRATANLIPGARYETIQDAGHLPCIEQPSATGALISGFLRETGHV